MIKLPKSQYCIRFNGFFFSTNHPPHLTRISHQPDTGLIISKFPPQISQGYTIFLSEEKKSGLIKLVTFLSVRGFPQQFYSVGEDRQNKAQAFQSCFRASRQVDDQRPFPDPGYCPG
jgi:hypothetical protein